MEFLVVFLMAMGIMSVNAGYFVGALMICIPIQSLKRKTLSLEAMSYPAFWLLLIWGVFYCLFSKPSLSYFRSYAITPILQFMAGWVVMRLSKGENDKTLKRLVSVVVLGFAVHALLNSLLNLNSNRATISDIFHNKILSATCAGGINTIILSLLTCLIHEKNKMVKGSGLVCFGIALVYASILASRTQLIIFLVVFVATFVLYLREHENKKLASRFLIGGAVICIALYIVYSRDIFGVKTFVELSNFYVRLTDVSLEGSDMVRIERFFQGLESLLENPFGVEAYYYHNMWLDIGRVAGTFPFLFMLLYSVLTTKHAINIFFCKQINIMTRYMVLSVYMGLLLNLFVEPAVEGMLDIVLTSFLLNGAVEYYYYNYRKTIVQNRRVLV